MTEITAEWLESIGFLQDGDDEGNKEYGKRAWSMSHIENSDDDTANMIQVLVSAKDHSVWLEVYDRSGDSLALIEVPGGTRARVLRLCEALGIAVAKDSGTEFCVHAAPHVYCDGCKVSPCPVGLD
jgi:hypothetical protein